MKRFLATIVILAATYCSYGQRCGHDFLYTKIIRNSDFIEERIRGIDEYMRANSVSIDSVFATTNGKYDIVFFEQYRYGSAIWGGYMFGHQAIISKVYKGNIVESYFVSYSWAEPPLSYPIQISHVEKPLEHIMEVKDFEFSFLHKDAVNLIEDDCKIIIPEEVVLIPGFGIKKEDNEE